MYDARCRRHHPQVLERILCPMQELVPLAIALKLPLGVIGKRLLVAKHVNLHRVIDDQIHRNLRIDAVRITAQPVYC